MDTHAFRPAQPSDESLYILGACHQVYNLCIEEGWSYDEQDVKGPVMRLPLYDGQVRANRARRATLSHCQSLGEQEGMQEHQKVMRWIGGMQNASCSSTKAGSMGKGIHASLSCTRAWSHAQHTSSIPL